MEPLTLDPYEQQLLAVFNRYDYDNLGSLDENGLSELCHTLQLQEQGTDLVRNLLNEPKKSRVKFVEFKDALLTLLGNMQKKHNNNNKEENKDNNESKGSPDREVSPKYIYGSKKYGRRSRPKSDLNDLNYLNTSENNKENPVQRSNSEVCNSKKRKTNFKLKRCTSLPSRDGGNRLSISSSFPNNDDEDNEQEELITCTEDMLRKAWKSLGVGEDGHLNRNELILVCDAIGLHNLATGVLRQLSIDKIDLDEDYDRKISFRELLDALKRDETWSDILDPLDNAGEEGERGVVVDCTLIPEVRGKEVITSSFPDSQTFQYISLGPEGNGIIGTDTVIDMWESVGITAPKELLHELGFDCRQIKMAELASVLDSSLKSINEAKGSENNFATNPHICLLQANLSLYQSEIRCLKGILEQLNAERDKLRYDLTEANNRATLLAQEVDDNHLRMQENTLKQVRLLEQRHADILKNLSRQFGEEKEELSAVNSRLEKKISDLESESARLKNDLSTAKAYLSTVESENVQLSAKIVETNQSKHVLEDRVAVLEEECRRCEGELERDKIGPLLDKLQRLELENVRLRDKGDEMGAEIEVLNGQICALRSTASSCNVGGNGNGMMRGMGGGGGGLSSSMVEDEVDVGVVFCGQGGGNGGGCVAAKRRNEGSPSKDVCLFESELGLSSPRLGKIRKLPKNDESDLPGNSSESGFSTEVECSDNSLCCRASPTPLDREVKRLQAKIVFLEQILQRNDIHIPSDEDLVETVWTDVYDVRDLKNRVDRLENVIATIKREFQSVNVEDVNAKLMIEKLSKMIVQDDLLAGKIYELKRKTPSEKSFSDAATSTTSENPEFDIMETVKKLEQQNGELTEKCAELENCIDLLRNEYEKCEDYWANKLDDERQIFELEQTQSNEKFAELFGKMREYEEQFSEQQFHEEASRSSSSLLPPIAETYSLEKQFTDLEDEYETYKSEMESLICEKDEEIALLKAKLTEIAVERENNRRSRGVQVDELNEYTLMAGKMSQLTAHVVECTSFSSSPQVDNWTTATNTSDSCRSSVKETSLVNNETSFVNEPSTERACRSFDAELSRDLEWSGGNQNACSSNSSSSSATAPCRPKRTRKHERDVNRYKKNASAPGGGGGTSSSSSGCLHHQAVSSSKKKTVMVGGGDDDNFDVNGRNLEHLMCSMRELNGRRLHLEQRCRHLQTVVKEQRCQAERTLQHCWQSQQNEKAELQCIIKYSQEKLEQYMQAYKEMSNKLARTDMLVKELYVENSYLIANVQRLEQQRNNILAQCSTNNSL